ncbi:DUF1275 domain-containing protein [bacterium]|nr:MAG: DUF1275 domain-containing protein [bacterium]
MIHKMPNWIWLGGVILSFFAGMINAISVLSFQHQAVSHVTGSLTQFGIHLYTEPFQSAWHILGVMFSFLLGAILSSLIIRDAVLSFGKRYGIVIMVESFFLAISIFLFKAELSYADFFVSAACGLQNAMATTYSGAIIRTTHMTGVITDLGILLGQFFRTKELPFLKLRLYVGLLLGFAIGGFIGAYSFSHLHFDAIWIPSISLFFAGLAYAGIRLSIEKGYLKLT